MQGLSTVAAKSAASGRDDVSSGWVVEGRTDKRQRQEQTTARAAVVAAQANSQPFITATGWTSRETIIRGCE
jgi:hypothetical protein